MKSQQKRYRVEKKQMILAAAAGIILIVGVLVLLKYGISRGEDLSQGKQYLEMLEARDADTINTKLKELEEERERERKKQLTAQLTATLIPNDDSMEDLQEDSIWNQFHNCVIVGDSRALGFSYYEFLPESQVLAEGGAIIRNVSDKYLEQLTEMKPERIFLCFGLNDMGIGFWPDVQDYAEECKTQIKALYQAIPDTEVYINLILPPVGVGLEADSNYPRYGEYNAAIVAMCEQEGFCYVDSTETALAHPELYQPDGLHLQREFYNYWAVNMLAEVGSK